MKKYFAYIILLMFSGAFLGCESDNKLGIDESSPGLNFRMVADVASFNSLAANTVDQEVTFTMYTEGNNIDNVTVLVDFFQFATNTTTSRGVLAQIDGTSLTGDGSSKLTLKLEDFLNATGVDFDDLAGGDVFSIYNIVELDNGQLYPDTVYIDTDGDGDDEPILNIENSFLLGTSSFVAQLNFPIVCPVTDAFTGTYSVTDSEGWYVGTAAITSNGGASRTFTGSSWGAPIGLNFAGTGFDFDLVCGSIFVAEQSIGLACGAGNAVDVVTSVNLGPGTYNDLDDSQFVIHVLYPNDNCIGGFDSILTLTKQ